MIGFAVVSMLKSLQLPHRCSLLRFPLVKMPLTAERRPSANHTNERAVNALKSAGITVDSCVTELASGSGPKGVKPNVADEELVSNTLQQIENLLNGLVAKAPPGVGL